MWFWLVEQILSQKYQAYRLTRQIHSYFINPQTRNSGTGWEECTVYQCVLDWVKLTTVECEEDKEAKQG